MGVPLTPFLSVVGGFVAALWQGWGGVDLLALSCSSLGVTENLSHHANHLQGKKLAISTIEPAFNNCPTYFGYNLENRIMPRFRFLVYAGRKFANVGTVVTRSEGRDSLVLLSPRSFVVSPPIHNWVGGFSLHRSGGVMNCREMQGMESGCGQIPSW